MIHIDKGEILALVRQLAKLEDDGKTIISLYLDTRWDEERKRNAVRLFVKSRLRTALAVFQGTSQRKKALGGDADAIRRQVDELIAPASEHHASGFALFACSARGLWDTIAAPQSFENTLVVRGAPYLIPLARLIDDFQTAYLCQVDSRSARILELVFGGVAGHETIDHPDVPGKHHQGGWSQMRYQRRIDWAREQHVREVADSFVKLSGHDLTARLFLSGPPEPLGMLRSALPKRILAREPVDIGLDLSTDLPVVLRAVLSQIESIEREQEAQRIRETLDAALAGHLAVAGPGDVVSAVNQNAISVLLVDRAASLVGWRCVAGCVVGIEPIAQSCPVCSGAALRCDLAARLVERVLASGGEVDIVASGTGLEAAGGIAARLRFGV